MRALRPRAGPLPVHGFSRQPDLWAGDLRLPVVPRASCAPHDQRPGERAGPVGLRPGGAGEPAVACTGGPRGGNVLEDAYIENRILEAFPGTLGQSLDFLRAWQWNDMPTVTQLKEREAQGQPVFFSLLQLFLSYGKFGELKYGEEPFAEEHIRTVFELLPELDEDLQSRSGKERWKTVNTILIRCWEQVREYGQNHDPKGPAGPLPGRYTPKERSSAAPPQAGGPTDGGIHRCGGLHHPQGAKAHGRGGRDLRPAGTPGCGSGLGG